MRTVTVIQNYRSANPGDLLILAGDFNEDVANGPFGVRHGVAFHPECFEFSYRQRYTISRYIQSFVLIANMGFNMADCYLGRLDDELFDVCIGHGRTIMFSGMVI